jgi:hypothetical protein
MTENHGSKGEVRPSSNTNEQLEDKIADEKDAKMAAEGASHELKKDS